MDWKVPLSLLMVFSLLVTTVSAQQPTYTTEEALKYKDDIISFIDGALGGGYDILNQFANARINVHIGGLADGFHIITKDKKVQSADVGLLDDPSVNVFSDTETLEKLRKGTLSPKEALKNGSIRWEDVGTFGFFVNFVNWLAISLFL